jgi:hypothetical protein
MSKKMEQEKSRIEDRLRVVNQKLWGGRPLLPHETLGDLNEERETLEDDLRRLNRYLQDHG